MLNAEKFRDEILNDDISTIGEINDKLYKLYYKNVGDCRFVSGKTVIQWLLSEYKEPILDKVEREYLSKVCEPYNVVGISKYFDDDVKSEFIDITILRFDGNEIDHIVLPEFKANSMYKGMEPSKDYDAKELGIKCKNNPNGEIKHE